MGKTMCWILLFITIAVNVVMVQWTVESYLGREYDQVIIYSAVAVVTALFALLVFINWKKIEYVSDHDE